MVKGDAPGGPQAVQLSEAMALRIKRHGRHPMGEEVEDADAGVAVVHRLLLSRVA